MKFNPLALQGAYVVEPAIHEDERGFFYRFFDVDQFKEIGHNKPWVQLNHSYTKQEYSLRGLHFQWPPLAEIKMVKCIAGKIFDVLVDLRRNSPTFLQWVGVELSAENKKMLYIPEGFAHGFQTLSGDCELIYHHTAVYAKDSEGGIRWSDPLINIQWPADPINISVRDLQHPLLTKEFRGIKL